MIVIPMAGNSSRFFAAGESRPKYELVVRERSLFDLAVSSFSAFFESEHFLFITRREFHAAEFIEKECEQLALESFEVREIEGLTRGQADTVAIGLARAGVSRDEPITIFNIDTIRPGYAYPDDCIGADGYLEVFPGAGDRWSFVRPLPGSQNGVTGTTEKERVSDACSTGLYYFARAAHFSRAFDRAEAGLEQFLDRWGELYVAPLYNALVDDGLDIRFHRISADEVMFSGTPAEYQSLLERVRE